MAPASAALYARWWQLETWLRELIYVELRAQLGIDWTDTVKTANGRQAQDAAFTRMSGPDNDNPLAYLDYAQLLDVIDRHWDQIGYALLDQRAWQGRQDELKRIRHRIGHLRKPHPDDLNRLEQTLRDLERGTFIALASYNDRDFPGTDNHRDAVTFDWLDGKHPDAKRLIDHADRQYETRLLVRASRRPWTKYPDDLAGAVSFESAHGSEPGFEPAMVTFDRGVRVLDPRCASATGPARPTRAGTPVPGPSPVLPGFARRPRPQVYSGRVVQMGQGGHKRREAGPWSLSRPPQRRCTAPMTAARPLDSCALRPHVAVLGGGISGLTTAYFLRRGNEPPHVTVIEAADRLGGKVLTRQVGEFQVDTGPDSLSGRLVPLSLLEDLGCAGAVVQMESAARRGHKRLPLRPRRSILAGAPCAGRHRRSHGRCHGANA